MQIRTGDLLRFRCHTGHAYTAEALVAHTADSLEASLWAVVRAMEENGLLLRRIAEQQPALGQRAAAQQLLDQARVLTQQTETIRQVLFQPATLPAATPATPDGTGGAA